MEFKLKVIVEDYSQLLLTSQYSTIGWDVIRALVSH